MNKRTIFNIKFLKQKKNNLKMQFSQIIEILNILKNKIKINKINISKYKIYLFRIN